jgi:phage gpG-like protein
VIAAVLVGDDRALSRLRSLPGDVEAGLVQAIARLATDLQRKVQDELSGQVLSTRSGSLVSSIDLRVDQSAAAVTATIFSDSSYARAHEYGFVGAVDVRAGLRRITEAFGRPIAGKTIAVRAHTRNVNLPQRSFLRAALEAMEPEIRDTIDTALREAVAG